MCMWQVGYLYKPTYLCIFFNDGASEGKESMICTRQLSIPLPYYPIVFLFPSWYLIPHNNKEGGSVLIFPIYEKHT